MRFVVRALDDSQQVQTVVLEALDEADAREQVEAQRMQPLSVGRSALPVRRESSRFALLLFTQELHALLVAGLSVSEALDALAEREPHALRRIVIQRLAARLREGHSLSSALSEQAGMFPPLFVGMVQAAERTSDIPRALSRYSEYQARLHSLRHKVTSAAIYPGILLVVGAAVGCFLLGYVVPRFAALYAGSGRPLPWASAMLLQWGQAANQNASALLAGILVLAATMVFAVQRKTDGEWLPLLRLVPGTRSKLEILELSRLYLTLGMLLEGGIPVDRAILLCETVVGPARRARLQDARKQVKAGIALSQAMQDQGLSTSVTQRLLRVGEHSAQLGAMLGRAAAFYDEEVTRWMERYSKAFEPALMAVIGIVIGLIVVLLYMPVFDLAGSLG